MILIIGSLVTLPKLNSSPLKNDGWKTILSFWVSVYFQGRAVKLPGGKPLFLGKVHCGGYVDQPKIDVNHFETQTSNITLK